MRCDLMNFEWAFNQTIVVEQSRGVESVDDRRVFNGIFVYCARAAPWRDLVERCRPYTAWNSPNASGEPKNERCSLSLRIHPRRLRFPPRSINVFY